MTLRNRVAAAAAAGVLIVVAAVSIVLYLSYAASLRGRVDGELVDAAQQASTIAQRVKQAAEEKAGVANFTGPVTVGSTEIELFPGPVAAGQATRFGPLDSRDMSVADHSQPAYFMNGQDGGGSFRIYTAAMPNSSAGGLVRTSRAANADDGALRTAAMLLATLTIAAAGATYCLGRLTAGRVLRPIADLTRAAEHVTHTQDLSARLGARSNDEVGRLAASFDAMLAALQDSVTAQQQLVADASHELRTPLTSLTTNLDLLEDGAGLADPEAPRLVRVAREQAGELDGLIADLLDLARFGDSASHREDVRLDLLTDEVVRRRRDRVPSVFLQTELRPCVVTVDPGAIDRAVGNLIDNAVKWSSPGGTVRVGVGAGQVTVTDHGPGVAEEDLPHIFERFYRAPAARRMPGAGLGLAIVGHVARANGGTVRVRTGPNGSTFILAFPQVPSSGTSTGEGVHRQEAPDALQPFDLGGRDGAVGHRADVEEQVSAP